MKNLLVRKATVSDIPYIYNINKICLPIYYSLIEYMFFITNKLVYVAEYKNIIVGYILSDLDQNNKKIHIMSFSVLNKFRRHGIGSMLINSLIEYATKENLKILSLYVHVENINAIKFYENHQFIKIKLLKDYYIGIPYEKSLDGYYMEKKIIS